MTKSIAVKDVSPDTFDLYKKREKVYQRAITGRFEKFRVLTIWVTLSIYFLLPWVQFADRQAVLFDLPERQFHIFWFSFWPQDLVLLSWLLIIAAFALFFFTNLLGRVWCGYTCPQTVWSKFFNWFEEITEGNRNQRIRLDASPLSANKVIRKSAKHFLWFALALATALTFVGYFTPISDLIFRFANIDLGGWEAFWILFFTAATYINAGWMREQVCTYMCPYARFQSVLFDKDTLVISYDTERGEPRGSRKKDANYEKEGLGSCIDCRLCVQVCPTGIDIRDGLQVDCIGCAACIDACDSIMDKMGYERGLVRYTTENVLEGKSLKILRPRLIGYGLALLVMSTLFLYVLSTRIPLELDIIRDRNQLYRETSEGMIQNVYTLKILNKDQATRTYQIHVEGEQAVSYHGKQLVSVEPGEVLSLPIALEVDPGFVTKPTSDVIFTIVAKDDNTVKVAEETRFISPALAGK